MKKLLLIILLLFVFKTNSLNAQIYQYQNLTLLSNWDDTTLTNMGWAGNRYSGCWGWANPVDGKEYAIIGGADGTYIVNVTNASSPVLSDSVGGIRGSCTWRELKTYSHYLYIVSDDAAPNGLQIADLSYLPDSVHVVHSGDSIIRNSHTIFVDGDHLYCGSVSGGTAAPGGFTALCVFSLANPESPLLLRKLNDDYPLIGHVHDMLVRNDTIYASCGYEGLHIYFYDKNLNHFTELGNLTIYPDAGYNHSSALTDDGNTLVFMDEVPEALQVKVLDVSDFSNLQIVSLFRNSTGATPHNPFILGNKYLFCAYYQDGVVAYDISDPSNPVKIGFFDTHWQSSNPNDSLNYVGCWGAYPWLPSGHIIASDMQNGLYMLDATALGIPSIPKSGTAISVSPNPHYDLFYLNISAQKPQWIIYTVYNTLGELVFQNKFHAKQGENKIPVHSFSLSQGLYFLTTQVDGVSGYCKVVKD